MSHSPRPSGSASTPPVGPDPWAAFGLLAAGVGFYGVIGWALGVWLHAKYLTAVGIVFGAALAIVAVFYMARVPESDSSSDVRTPPGDNDEAPHDRGETE